MNNYTIILINMPTPMLQK